MVKVSAFKLFFYAFNTFAVQIEYNLKMSFLKGQTLTLESKGRTVTVNWKQGSVLGFGGDSKQDYALCKYSTSGGERSVYFWTVQFSNFLNFENQKRERVLLAFRRFERMEY